MKGKSKLLSIEDQKIGIDSYSRMSRKYIDPHSSDDPEVLP